MKDEIKQILDKIKICKNCRYHYLEEISFDYPQSCCNKTCPHHTTEQWCKCDNFEYSDDYITNLQTIEQQYSAILSENAELENKIINLQKENERLKN